MKKLLIALTAVLLAFGSLPAPHVSAQANGVYVAPFAARPVANIVTALDTDVALYVKYFPPVGGVAPATTPTLAVESDANLTFVVNGAAYAGFECPVSGALGGVIDVSDAACNTFGEVVDVINATAPNFATGYFRAVIAAGLRSDASDQQFLAQAAISDVTKPGGQAILWDESFNDDIQIGLWDTNLGIGNWLSGQRLVSNGFADSDSVLLYAHENLTNAGTITNLSINCTVENYSQNGSSEVNTVLYLEAAGATTATGKVDEFLNAGGLRCRGGKLWMRVLASGADTSAQLYFVTGYRTPSIK